MVSFGLGRDLEVRADRPVVPHGVRDLPDHHRLTGRRDAAVEHAPLAAITGIVQVATTVTTGPGSQPATWQGTAISSPFGASRKRKRTLATEWSSVTAAVTVKLGPAGGDSLALSQQALNRLR